MAATATEPAQTVNEIVVKIKTNPAWLRWKREQAKVTQLYVAIQLGVHPSHISNIECGATVCSERIMKWYEELRHA